MIYLDAAATAQVRREALEAAWPYLTTQFGNPSSHHTVGEGAARALKEARAQVAAWFGTRAGDIVFTSGGTEADNLAVKGIALATPRGRHIVTTTIEHEAVLQSVDYLRRVHDFEVTMLDVDRTGLVDQSAFAAALRPDTTLATIMYANNEVGTVQPINALSAIAKEHGIPFHTDAVQAAGWLDCTPAHLGADAISVSGHKLGAPKGIGALYVRSRIPLEPVLHGGGQERGRRSGTENVAGAVALATAMRLGAAERQTRAEDAAQVRDRFISAVTDRIPQALLTGHPSQRLPASASFLFPGTNGEAVLIELEQRGVVSSSGSACAAGSTDASHVLKALGYPEDDARTAVRFSWSPDVDEDDLLQTASAIGESVDSVTGMAP